MHSQCRPTQLHPNSWAFMQAFRVVCKFLSLSPSSKNFLHFYSSRPGKHSGWLSLINWSKACFQKLHNKPGSSTPQSRREAEVVEPISRVEAIPDNTKTIIVEAPKKSRKRDKSSRRSHSLPRRHRHGVGSSSASSKKSFQCLDMFRRVCSHKLKWTGKTCLSGNECVFFGWWNYRAFNLLFTCFKMT